ncbi:MAG: hypothetical protein JST00_22330 [Deltaproteobacteria bacterium]|nr:hypothetical protein [Deltaproteobacteria bacterium]
MKRSRIGFLCGALLAVASGGCLSRPVGTDTPTTKVAFSSTVSQQAIDKIDLLFMIDNSKSMADKQAILARAVPDLLHGLVEPKCVDPETGRPDPSKKSADPKASARDNFGCPAGTEPEFRPVTDIHIGVISSSLGGSGGDLCPNGTRSNDRAHLIGDASGGFLSWYPDNETNADKKRHPQPVGKAFGDATELSSTFAKIVTSVGQSGCGLEAQMESWYRFLVQPDPWKEIRIEGDQASLGAPGDIDYELLKQRADFLRPDSLVAVVLLTDEDDASIDPLSSGGRGWMLAKNSFGDKSGAPRATSACAIDPGSPDCASCSSAATCNPASDACRKIKEDPECKRNGGAYTAEEDDSNARFGHQLVKRTFGVDVQYPISRYTLGLTNVKVPDRSTEHPESISLGKRVVAPYLGTGKCTNPLFAAKLPSAPGDETCNLPRGSRTPDQVFFAVVGGVPHQLLHGEPGEADRGLSGDDWVKILGKNPERYDYTGIDPHMVQSKEPRPGLAAPRADGDNGPDPINGREWATGGHDLQYACTFELDTPRDCQKEDCDRLRSENAPLWNAAGDQQVRAKAYPSVRELMAVRALGERGVAASLCPKTLKGDPRDPSYGYNPAMRSILDRMKGALTTQCLPRKLTRDSASNEVPCLVLAQLADASDSCEKRGLERPEEAVVERFLEQKRAEAGNVALGADPTKLPVCKLPQLTVPAAESCKDAAGLGWCYVEGSGDAKPAGRCSQAILFSSATAVLAGAKFDMLCIQQPDAEP